MTRSTYFAAFRPSDGLRFPASAAVYPVLSTDEAYDRLDRSQASPREIVLGDESQQFLGDFLTPRNQTQFVHYEPKAAQEGLRLVADPSGTPRVANHLSETLHQLVARSADGTYWMLPSPCPSGETAPLAPLANHQRMEALRDLYQVQPLEPPPGFVPPIGRRYYYYAYDARSVRRVDSQSWSQSGDEEGVFEAELRVVLTSHRDLRPGSFVGVADLSADALAIEGAEVTDSIHYVMGNFLPEGVE